MMPFSVNVQKNNGSTVSLLVREKPITYFAQLALLVAFGMCVLGSSGCSTLSTLGLPFGDSNNRLLRAAKKMSEIPTQSIRVPKELEKQALGTYIVEIGDTLLVEPVKFDATIRLPGDQIVKPDGHISLGEFGRFYAANKTLEQIQLEIQSTIDRKIRSEKLDAFNETEAPGQADSDDLEFATTSRRLKLVQQDDESISDDEEKRLLQLEKEISDEIDKNQVSVRLINWESKKFFVLGEVNSPGSFTFSGNETVLDAIVEAGGLASNANRHQIIVARPTTCDSCRIVMKVCFDQVVQLGDASTNYQIQPGDRIFIPSLTFADDLKKTLRLGCSPRCPRCADCQRACDLPQGCR